MSTEAETQQDQCPMFATAQAEHEWLQQLVGEWAYESESVMGPDQPSMKTSGTETVRSIGGLWVVCKLRGEMPDGGTFTSIMTIGYDAHKARYLGTFIASMMTHLWIYDGKFDKAANSLTLSAEGPSMSGDGSMSQYRDVVQVSGPDRRSLTSFMLGDDGQWHQIMKAEYRRVS